MLRTNKSTYSTLEDRGQKGSQEKQEKEITDYIWRRWLLKQVESGTSVVLTIQVSYKSPIILFI
jgi:hypothetical protein